MSASVRERGSGFLPRRWLACAGTLLPLLLGGCERGCVDEVVMRALSPDGRNSAVVFVRDCGSAAGFATHVAVVPDPSADARDADVVYVADGNDGAAPAGAGGGPTALIRWMDAGRLEVMHHPRARTLRKADSLHGVGITYVPLP